MISKLHLCVVAVIALAARAGTPLTFFEFGTFSSCHLLFYLGHASCNLIEITRR